MAASDRPPGVARVHRNGKWVGYRVSQWVPWPGYPDGRVFTKRYNKTATFEEMRHWREARRVEARRRRNEGPSAPLPIVGSGFLADADRYLEAVVAMTTYKERRKHILEWAAIFGEQERDAIDSSAIRAARDRMLTVGPKMVQERQADGKVCWMSKPIPLSPQSVNLRLRALENLWTVLDGPKADNPVREVPECTPPDPKPRGETFSLGLEILAHMPDRARPVKGGTHEPGSLSRVRFECMLLTGLQAKQLGALRPEHIDWTVPAFLPPRRNKGRKSRRQRAGRSAPTARPLMPEAAAALKRLFALGGNTPFSSSSLAASLRRAIAKANDARAKRRLPLIDPRLPVKDLTRHTFGTEVYRTTKNLKQVQELMGHSDIQQSARYAMAAIREDLTVGIGELSKRVRTSAPRPRRDAQPSAGRARAGLRSGGKVGGKVSASPRASSVRTGQNRSSRNPQ